MVSIASLSRLGLVLVWLIGFSVPSSVGAQQLSRELQELRDTSNAFYRAGDYAQSLRFAEQALPLFIRELGPDHEQTGIHYYSHGQIAEAVGNRPLALRYYTETVRVREKVYGADGPGVAEALEKLGSVHLRQGRPDQAEPIFRRALKLKKDLIGFRHVYEASGHSNLGDVALARGDWPAALASYREAISLLTQRDTSQIVVKQIADDDIRRHRDTFVGLCRAAWETRAAGRAAVLEETFPAIRISAAASAPCRTSPSASCSSTPTTRSC